MVKETFFVEGLGGQQLFVRCYKEESKPGGEGQKNVKVIQILHGMAEFGDRYEPFAQVLVAQGYRVYVHDHRKHGYSLSGSQKVGYYTNDTWEQMVGDVQKVQVEILSRESVDSLFMFGHSMGSFLLRSFLMDFGDRVSAAVICGTANTNGPLSLVGVMAAKLLARVVGHKPSVFLNNLSVGGYNKAFEPTQTSADWLTSDHGLNQWYVEHPLCGYPYTPKFYEEIAKGLRYIIKDDNIVKTPKIPLLFISGDHDPVGEMGKGVESVRQKYETLGYDTQLTLFKNARHEILNDTCKDQVYERILAFFG